MQCGPVRQGNAKILIQNTTFYVNRICQAETLTVSTDYCRFNVGIIICLQGKEVRTITKSQRTPQDYAEGI